MQDSQAPDFDTLRAVAEKWLNRPLSNIEQEQLRQFAVSARASQTPPATDVRTSASSRIDAERQRVQGLLAQMLHMTQDTRGGLSVATDTNEASVLRTVEAASAMDGPRLGQLRPPQNGDGRDGQQATAQIADRLADLVQSEVKACFDRQFGSLAQQMQAVIDAARAQGLIGAAPPAEQGAPPPSPAI
ncbi:hypothetical protein NRY95_06540 [Xanthomonas campestris pv. phormiicola]|nr:hypothetical protein [Xanthomonas campestris pv. phormiicola]UYC17610.1 hypothetical protein NRY95_06540 [Xanthomonas campestris pv. phormiicola]